MAIKKLKTKDGWDIITIERQGYKEHIISVDIGNGITSTKDIAGKIRVLGMEVLGQFILAGCEQYEPVRKAMGHIDWPLTWIQGDACRGGRVTFLPDHCGFRDFNKTGNFGKRSGGSVV